MSSEEERRCGALDRFIWKPGEIEIIKPAQSGIDDSEKNATDTKTTTDLPGEPHHKLAVEDTQGSSCSEPTAPIEPAPVAHKRQPGQRSEELPLTELDEEALDRAWARVARENSVEYSDNERRDEEQKNTECLSRKNQQSQEAS